MFVLMITDDDNVKVNMLGKLNRRIPHRDVMMLMLGQLDTMRY